MLKYLMFGLFAATAGCSDDAAGHDGAHDPAAEDVGAESGGDDVAVAADTGAAAVDAPTGKPATPAVTTVMAMAGAWHVAWKTNDTTLTKIELWRTNDGAEATLVKSFAGTAKDWHDAVATGTTVKYCWTVKTFRGADASDASTEKCSK